MFLLGLMSMLLVTRHTRQEEETGRAELVSAGVVGRYAWLAASLLYVLAVNVVLAALTAAGYVAMGLRRPGRSPWPSASASTASSSPASRPSPSS